MKWSELAAWVAEVETVAEQAGYQIEINTAGDSGPRGIVFIPDLPVGLRIRKDPAILRRWGPIRRRYYVVVGDPEWDNKYSVRADDKDQAILYLTRDRRKMLQAQPPGWGLSSSGNLVFPVDTSDSDHPTSAVRQGLYLAAILDPTRTEVPSEQPEIESGYQFPAWYEKVHWGFAAYSVALLLFGLITDRLESSVIESIVVLAFVFFMFWLGLGMLTKGVATNDGAGRWVFGFIGSGLLFFAILGPLAMVGFI